MTSIEDVTAVIAAYTGERVAAAEAKAATDLANLQAQFDAYKQANPTPAPVTRPIFGVSNSQPNSDYWTRQTVDLKARAMYHYRDWTKWGDCASVPDDHDIWFQTKASTRAEFDAMLATFPATRTGKVFLHYWNEPEDNMPAADYKARCADLFAAIDAAKRPYVVKAVELNGYTLVKGQDPTLYVPPGTQHVGWSVYGGMKVVNGHADGAVSPQQWADLIGAANTKIGLPWSVAAFGLALSPTYTADPISRQNRVAWAEGVVSKLSALPTKPRGFLWYDALFNGGAEDYRIATDPDLKAWWLSKAT